MGSPEPQPISSTVGRLGSKLRKPIEPFRLHQPVSVQVSPRVDPGAGMTPIEPNDPLGIRRHGITLRHMPRMNNRVCSSGRHVTEITPVRRAWTAARGRLAWGPLRQPGPAKVSRAAPSIGVRGSAPSAPTRRALSNTAVRARDGAIPGDRRRAARRATQGESPRRCPELSTAPRIAETFAIHGAVHATKPCVKTPKAVLTVAARDATHVEQVSSALGGTGR